MKTIFNKLFLNILFCLLVFMLPIQTRYFLFISKINNNYFEYSSIALYLIDIYLLFFIIYLFIYNFKKQLFKINYRKITLVSVLFLFNIFLNLSLIKSIDIHASIYFNIKFFILSILIFLLSFVRINFYSTREAFIVMSSFQALLSIYQFIIQHINPNKFLGIAEQAPYNLGVFVIENYSNRFLRSYGSFPHPNILSLFLIIGSVFLLSKIFNTKEYKYKKYFYCYLFGINFMGIVLTFSRISIFFSIVLLLATFVYLIYKYIEDKENNIKKHIKFFILIFFIEISISFFFKNYVFLRFDNNNRLNIISNNERDFQYKESFSVIKDNYLLGVGQRNYSIYIKNKNNKLNSWDIKPVHNIYLLLLSEIGVFGFLTFISLLIITLFIKCNIEYKISYILILLFGLFDHFLITETFGIIFLFLFIGIIFSKKTS